jgi:hypothetical protein
MPSPAHEWMVALLTDDPRRLDVLLRVLRRMGLRARFVVVDAAVHLVNAMELRPDALLIDPDTGRWLALEVQLHIDEEKRTMWPLLAAYLTRKHGTMGDVLVITPDASVAAWAETGWHLEGALGSSHGFAPAVVLLGEREAYALLASPSPEMAVFAAWAMQARKGSAALEIVTAALRRLDEIEDSALKMSLTQSILAVLAEPLREVLLAMLAANRMPKPEPWLEELIARFEARGEARGKALALIRLLQRRGVAYSADDETRITACADVNVLDDWLDRAATAVARRDVFGDG